MSAAEPARTGPLTGARVLVPVTADRPRPLVTALAELGADARTVELARIERADTAAIAVDRLTRRDVAVDRLGARSRVAVDQPGAASRVAWLAFTSSHAVAALDAAAREAGTTLGALVSPAPHASSARAIDELGRPHVAPPRNEASAASDPDPSHAVSAPVRIAAVGPATAAALAELGIAVDLVPVSERSAAGLLAAWPAPPEAGPRVVVVPHGDLAEPTLPDGLRARGWDVETVVVYRNLPGPPLDAGLREDLAAGRVDVVLLTSGSVAERLFTEVSPSPTTAFVALGPRTAQAVAALGVDVAATSPGPETAGLVWAVATALDARENAPMALGSHLGRTKESA